jgi:hypothetical protein
MGPGPAALPAACGASDQVRQEIAGNQKAITGAVLAIGGLAVHLVSLAAFLRHRRRRLELLHGFGLGTLAHRLALLHFRPFGRYAWALADSSRRHARDPQHNYAPHLARRFVCTLTKDA